ncbi:FIG00949750: hypothetical protein [Pseudoalteromonas luteoviolacea B = ATCC 29581]|nr:FIG00949750: hypothetical protein [Pseudoalteromonas luteoviolacea B = ATCC 29581]
MMRIGPDYRHGDQVDFDDIRKTFGFNTIKIGSWVTKQERLEAANQIYDALADLTLILNIQPTIIGLRESLNFAYGTGGQLGVQAHYDAQSRTIALAKHAGRGALAHEWWHAFDHYISKFLFSNTTAHDFASRLWLERKIDNLHTLNKLLNALFSALFLDETGQHCSNYFNRAKDIDSRIGAFYYAKPEELTARAFELFIAKHRDIKNAYLVDSIEESDITKRGAFPNDDLFRTIQPIYLTYFKHLAALYRHHLD